MADIQRIICIGFRATGKSAVGRELAAQSGLSFLDTDEVLQQRLGSSIRNFVRSRGWQEFRQREHQLLQELSAARGLVIATGGGGVLHQDIWPDLRRASLVVWLKATTATIRGRIAADSASPGQRPALAGDNALEEIDALLAVREPLYQASADCTLATDGLSIQEITTQILQRTHGLTQA